MKSGATLAVALFALVGTTGCPSTAPPASRFPSVEAAVDRMHAGQACGLAVQANAKIDHFGKQGRVRGDLLMMVAVPARIRMDAVSPFGVTLATLTSDGSRFALADLRDKRFYSGPAKACNIARLTTVPIPGPVLVDLLRGEAPVLKRGGAAGTIQWNSSGYYVVTIPGTNNAVEEIHLVPRPEDFARPWAEQRVRILSVEVRQEGLVLYRAELADHAQAATAKPRVDPDGIDAPIPPSGPACDAELPRRIHVEVPGLKEDVLFRYEQVTWNPPLIRTVFTQPPQAGLAPVDVDCD
jgi:hypothetical protein